MHVLSRTLVKSVIWIAVGMVVVVTFHLGGTIAHSIGQFAPLSGAFIGGCLVLLSGSLPERLIPTQAGQWNGWEETSWLFIGVGIIAWGIGDSFWRYYGSIGLNPFPSLADIGYVTFTILIFIGLLLQPSSYVKGRRLILIMDSVIATGSILAIGWYLLLGPLALAPTEGGLAKILGLYYPASDTILLSSVVFLLLRWQGPVHQSLAYGISLLIIGIGLCFFITSDFLFNIQQNAGTYVDATWVDLGWPLGLMTIGIAAILRRFPPSIPEALQAYIEEKAKQATLTPPQYMPYGLFAALLVVLTCNVLSVDHVQQAIRPVLVLATLVVVSLVILRQVVTLRENVQLVKQQAATLEQFQSANQQLYVVNQQIEEQTRLITVQNVELEEGIEHLRKVLAHMANGDLQARATTTQGILWPLAASLNALAERMERLGQDTRYSWQLTKALSDLSAAVERGSPLFIPETCYSFSELSQLIAALQRWENLMSTNISPQQLSSPPLPAQPPMRLPSKHKSI